MQRLSEIQVSADELAAARAGDVAMRGALLQRVAPATLAIIRRLVAQRAMAEDLLQDTLILMSDHRDDNGGEAPSGVGVEGIAAGRCLRPSRRPGIRGGWRLNSWREKAGGGRPTPRVARRISSISIARSRGC